MDTFARPPAKKQRRIAQQCETELETKWGTVVIQALVGQAILIISSIASESQDAISVKSGFPNT